MRSWFEMSELRWNPVTREWIIMALERQSRPVLPEGYCPFEPGASDEVPGEYDVISIPNKFPSLRRHPPQALGGDDFFMVAPARGACEVVLYSDDHRSALEDEPVDRIRKVVDVWQERYVELGREPYVDYVFIFENRGREIGVTLEHPHGQIYAYPYIPRFVERRLEGARDYHNKNGRCLFCETIEREEEASPSRIVVEDDPFIAVVPFWAKWSYEVSIYPKRHVRGIDELDEAEKGSLARMLKTVLLKYDGLFGFRLPYIMAVHQRPTDNADDYRYCHLSLEFYPPHRSRDNLKYLAGSETGAGAHINVTSPEVAAEALRAVSVDDNL